MSRDHRLYASLSGPLSFKDPVYLQFLALHHSDVYYVVILGSASEQRMYIPHSHKFIPAYLPDLLVIPDTAGLHHLVELLGTHYDLLTSTLYLNKTVSPGRRDLERKCGRYPPWLREPDHKVCPAPLFKFEFGIDSLLPLLFHLHV